MTLSTTVADKISAALAAAHYVEVEDKKYTAAPVQTRGIPHGYIPGVHAVLADTVAAVDGVLAAQGHDISDVVTGLFSLPFSAFTQVCARVCFQLRAALTHPPPPPQSSQALRPDVESTSDSTLRHCFREVSEISCATGRSYLPDATAEDEVRS